MIRLNNIQTVIGQQPAKGMDAMLLFTSRNRNRKRVRNLFGTVEPIKEYRFFEVTIVVILELLTHSNRFVHVFVVAVCIGIERHIITKGFANKRDD